MLNDENGICNMLNYENRNCKVCLNMKIETASMLNYEDRNCKMLNYENRNCKYA